jgi:hypothetical protein
VQFSVVQATQSPATQVPVQFSVVQATQSPATQTPVQFSVEHGSHAPVSVLQRFGSHSGSVSHPRQVPSSQMGSAGSQCALLRHSTQLFSAEHIVLGGGHSLTSDGVHSTHAPLLAHTLSSGQLPLLQATHSIPLQIGVVPLQLLLFEQATHVGSDARGCHTPPTHSSASPDWQRSAPSSQMHVPVSSSQTGV